jgi:3-polyprenyl-4-hydroxybenzoate decarboxylase
MPDIETHSVPAFYNRVNTLDDIVNHTVRRVLARLGVNNVFYDEWQCWRDDGSISGTP